MKNTLIVASALLFGGAAAAQPPVVVYAPADVVVRHISYADLNLASASGEKTLRGRVNGAIGDLCLEATGGDNGSFSFKYSMMKCDNRAWGEARPQIARAVQRARDLAANGTSTIPVVAISITAGR